VCVKCSPASLIFLRSCSEEPPALTTRVLSVVFGFTEKAIKLRAGPGMVARDARLDGRHRLAASCSRSYMPFRRSQCDLPQLAFGHRAANRNTAGWPPGVPSPIGTAHATPWKRRSTPYPGDIGVPSADRRRHEEAPKTCSRTHPPRSSAKAPLPHDTKLPAVADLSPNYWFLLVGNKRIVRYLCSAACRDERPHMPICSLARLFGVIAWTILRARIPPCTCVELLCARARPLHTG